MPELTGASNHPSCYPSPVLLIRPLSEGFGDLNLTDIDFGYCTALDLGVIFDVIFKFEGLTKLGLGGLKMESLPERKPFTPPLNCSA